MAAPVLDEDDILDLLAVPVQVQTVSALQAGAVQALIDLYDRKVTREEFIKSAAPCINLFGQAAKLWMLHNINLVFSSGELTQKRFDDAAKGLSELTAKQAEAVTEIVKGLSQCPGTEDKIH